MNTKRFWSIAIAGLSFCVAGCGDADVSPRPVLTAAPVAKRVSDSVGMLTNDVDDSWRTGSAKDAGTVENLSQTPTAEVKDAPVEASGTGDSASDESGLNEENGTLAETAASKDTGELQNTGSDTEQTDIGTNFSLSRDIGSEWMEQIVNGISKAISSIPSPDAKVPMSPVPVDEEQQRSGTDAENEATTETSD